MKRFHVHVVVDNLTASTGFYSKLFGQPPVKQKPDYAQWMLDDPRLNFAISSRGHNRGVNHFGMQADSLEELINLRVLADNASDGVALDQGSTTCCYAESEKHWTIDPQGLAWEHFFTLSDTLEFGDDTLTEKGACCIPLHSSNDEVSEDSTPCCIPPEKADDQTSCCD